MTAGTVGIPLVAPNSVDLVQQLILITVSCKRADSVPESLSEDLLSDD